MGMGHEFRVFSKPCMHLEGFVVKTFRFILYPMPVFVTV